MFLPEQGLSVGMGLFRIGLSSTGEAGVGGWPHELRCGIRHDRVVCQRFLRCDAKVAELVDALDLGSSGVTRESSSLSFRTIKRNRDNKLLEKNDIFVIIS